MDWTLNFRDDGILDLKCSGSYSNNDLLLMIEQTILDPRWETGMNILLDFRDIIFKDIHYNDIIITRDIHVQFNEFIGTGKIATIHSNDFGYEIGRLYEELAEGSASSKISIFKDYDLGIRWLCGDYSYLKFS